MKRFVCSVLAIMLLFSVISVSSVVHAMSSETDVIAALDSLMQTGNYQLKNTSWGDKGCWKFANAVSKQLFGIPIPNYPNGYSLDNIASYPKWSKVGTYSGANATQENLKTLLQQAKPGDIIQYAYGGSSQHTAVIYKTTGTGYTIYDFPNTTNGVRLLELAYSRINSGQKNELDFHSRSSYGMSLYHYSDYALTYSPDPAAPSGGNAPAAPTGLTGVRSGTSDVLLSWNAISGATSYEVEYSRTGTNWTALAGSPTTATTILGKGFSWNYDYVDFRVRAVNSGGASSWTQVRVNKTASATYTISYNANGGSNAPAAQTKTHDQALTLSTAKPTRSGYTFLGWAESSAATAAVYQPGGSFTKNADTTLYAVWRMNTYTLTYNANGGSGAPAALTVTAGTPVTLSATIPIRDGYTFIGWSELSTAEYARYPSAFEGYTVNENTTLYAIWRINPSNLVASTDKSSYLLGETVHFTLSADNATKYAISVWDGGVYGQGTCVYNSGDSDSGSFSYTPRAAGSYGVGNQAKNDAETSISVNTAFTVVSPTLTAQANADGSVTLDWGFSPSDATWYWIVSRSTTGTFTNDNIVARPSGALSGWTDTNVEPGMHYYYRAQPIASDGSWAGEHTNVAEVTMPSCYLDVNGLLDGKLTNRLDGYATVDVYINGNLVADDSSDYWGAWSAGTRYEIRDIKPLAGYQFEGLSDLSLYTDTDYSAQLGGLSGTLNGSITEVVLIFAKEPAKPVVVTEVTLNHTSLSLTAGDSAALSAAISPADATNNTVAWASSDSSVVTVDSTGKVTAVAPGTATITATAGDKSASCIVTVEQKKTLQIGTASLPGGTVGEAYSQPLIANTAEAVTWTVSSGALPEGLTLTGNVISGTPTRAGVYAFTVTAVCGSASDSREYTITVSGSDTAAPADVHFPRVNVYHQDQFTDVKANQWFTPTVASAFELGLMKGSSATTFKPYGDVTIAEAVTMAARIHSIATTGSERFVQTGKWYQVYLDYAYQNGIIDYAYYNSDVTQKATRAQFAEIFANSLPAELLPAINSIADNAVPDVPMSAAYSGFVYRLYRAGILTGSDALGTFHPDTFITRAEAATIVSRMAESGNRVEFGL